MTNEQQKPVAPPSNPTVAPAQNPPQQTQGDNKPDIDKSGAQPQQK